MRKWNMTMRFWQDVEFEVEADTYDEAVTKAYDLAQDVRDEDLEEIQCELHDYEELPSGYELADGYFDDSDEEEEFEPGRPILDQMALNP